MLTTLVVQIGNSDDKLSQAEWTGFCAATWAAVGLYATQVHFEGYSVPTATWQNACWVAEIDPADLKRVRHKLAEVADLYRQDSIAVTLGITEMVSPTHP